MASRISLAAVETKNPFGKAKTPQAGVLRFPGPSAEESLDIPDSLESFRGLSLKELDLEFDPHHGALWCVKRHTVRPNFTRTLIDDIKTVQKCMRSAFRSAGPEGVPIKYMVWASSKKNIFNLGGDLIHFVELLTESDRAGLESYAHSCVDICSANHANMDLPILTIALVQGDALGGGLESALSNDVIIAERSALFGFPEILFGLFPGMGAYSFVSRRVGSRAADDMIFSGRILGAEKLYELGLVDVLAAEDEGEKELDSYLKKNKTKFNAHQALFQTRRQTNPVSTQEMHEIAERWVDVAMGLSERDVKKMRRLASAQMKRMEKIDQEASATRSGPDQGLTRWAASGERLQDSPPRQETSSIVRFGRDQKPDSGEPTPPDLQKKHNERERNKIVSSPDKPTRERPPKKASGNNIRKTAPAGLQGEDPPIYIQFMEDVAEARAAATLQPGVERMLSEGLSKEDYLSFLEQLYHVVWHFCPTMASAAARCGDEYRELRYALYQSIADEKGHENWVLEDIEALGGDPEAVKASTPSVPVQAMVGHNYHVAEHRNPWSVMGMVHVLEEISANYAGRVGRIVAKRLGITDGKGFRFLDSHGLLDIEHAGEFKNLILNANPDEDLKAMTDSADVNYALFGALFKDE